jgi:hypothetical protein
MMIVTNDGVIEEINAVSPRLRHRHRGSFGVFTLHHLGRPRRFALLLPSIPTPP